VTNICVHNDRVLLQFCAASDLVCQIHSMHYLLLTSTLSMPHVHLCALLKSCTHVDTCSHCFQDGYLPRKPDKVCKFQSTYGKVRENGEVVGMCFA